MGRGGALKGLIRGLLRSVQPQSIFCSPTVAGRDFINDRLLLEKCSSYPFGNKRNARCSTLDPLPRARRDISS